MLSEAPASVARAPSPEWWEGLDVARRVFWCFPSVGLCVHMKACDDFQLCSCCCFFSVSVVVGGMLQAPRYTWPSKGLHTSVEKSLLHAHLTTSNSSAVCLRETQHGRKVAVHLINAGAEAMLQALHSLMIFRDSRHVLQSYCKYKIYTCLPVMHIG